MMVSPQLHADFKRCLQQLAADYGVWVVGGWVRDALLGLTPHDADFTTSAPMAAIEAAAKGCGLVIIHDAVAQAHGIYCLHAPGSQLTLDLACLRTDQERMGERHARVAFTTDLNEDLARRDLTINAMAVPYPFGQNRADEEAGPEDIIDPFLGRAHLQQRLLKLVGPPHDRLDEDPLRLLRVARFACLGDGWTIDASTCAALEKAAPKLARISFERVRQETLRAMSMAQPARYWQVVARARAQGMLLPPAASGQDFCLPQAIFWLKHAALCTPACEGRLVAFFAGLLGPQDGAPPPPGHAEKARAFVGACLAQWRCSRELIHHIGHTVGLIPWDADLLRGERLARWLIDLGAHGYALMDALLQIGSVVRRSSPQSWQALRARVHGMVGEGPWPATQALALSGADVMRLLQLPPGPQVGHALHNLLVWATANHCLQNAHRLAEKLQACPP